MPAQERPCGERAPKEGGGERAGARAAGTTEEASKQKSGYKLPRAPMANADLARLINSDEIQSVVRPARSSRAARPLKKNPLKNLGALLKLNPYAKTARRMELLAEARARARRPLRRASLCVRARSCVSFACRMHGPRSQLEGEPLRRSGVWEPGVLQLQALRHGSVPHGDLLAERCMHSRRMHA